MTIQSVAIPPKSFHISGCKAWLKSCVKEFARSAYLSTILPLMQLKTLSAALGVLPAIIGLLLIGSTTAAQASSIEKSYFPKDFYDFEFAQKVWKEMSDPEMSNWLDNKCAKGSISAYGLWMKSYKSAPQQALQALESHPKAQEIKKCHDVLLTFKQWIKIYRMWRTYLQADMMRTKGWNKNTGGLVLTNMSMLNIFTHGFNDIPDWRNPDAAKEDAQWLARNNKKRAAWENKARLARERASRPGSFHAAFEKSLARHKKKQLAHERLQQKAGQ